jgi:4-carboxymuconolactone decarboxylase
MARLPLVTEEQVSPALSSAYRKAAGNDSGLSDTFRALFNSSKLASQLAGLDELVSDPATLEPWVRFTVALTVAKEVGNHALWEAFEPQARQAGVRDTVIDAIAAGTAPRGLLPKEGIWAQFAIEVLRDQVRDSTWQAVCHLAGEPGAVNLAAAACYYHMMARLNQALALDAGQGRVHDPP